MLAARVRRLHDLDRSGWWICIAFVPIAGAILLIVWDCTKGSSGENRFGDDPLEGQSGISELEQRTKSKRPRNLDDLERLFALHEKGVLTKEEFEAQKADILS
jgi:hypothetical protein